jgi:hypothetical protein
MDMIVLCRCGHPSALHGERGCRAGRYQPCECLLDSPDALEAAIVAAGTDPRKAGLGLEQISLHK